MVGCQIFLTRPISWTMCFSGTSFLSQLCAEALCTCVINNKGMSSRAARGQASIRGLKNDTRPSSPLFVVYYRSRALDTAFNFKWWTSVCVFQITGTCESLKDKFLLIGLTVDYITAGRSLALDKQQSQHYVYLRQLPLAVIKNTLNLPQTLHHFTIVT